MSWLVLVVGVFFVILQWTAFVGARASIIARCNEWVTSCKKRERVAQTRESAVADLERVLALNPRFGLLRRLGVVAPLLGVTLTAGSVLLGGVSIAPDVGGTTSLSSGQAQTSVAAFGPLFWGVCVGAVLAMFNQLLVHRASAVEDELFRSAIEPRASAFFRDSDDRLDVAIRQIEAAGISLGRSITGVEQVLRASQDVMTKVQEAGVQAATNFTKFATGFEATMASPVRSLSEAAAEMRGGAVEATRQFGIGVKSLVQQSAAIEKSVSLTLQRQESAAARQADSAEAIAAAAGSIDAMLAPLRSSTVAEFERCLVAANTASASFSAVLGEAEARVATAASAVPAALAAFSSGLEAASKDERSRVAAAFAEAVAEARTLAVSIRTTAVIAAEASNAGGSAIEELGRSIEALRTYTAEFASHMELLSKEAARRVAGDDSMGKAAQSAKVAIEHFRTALSSSELFAVGSSAAQLNQSVRELAIAFARARAEFERKSTEFEANSAPAESGVAASAPTPGYAPSLVASAVVAPLPPDDLQGGFDAKSDG